MSLWQTPYPGLPNLLWLMLYYLERNSTSYFPGSQTAPHKASTAKIPVLHWNILLCLNMELLRLLLFLTSLQLQYIPSPDFSLHVWPTHKFHMLIHALGLMYIFHVWARMCPTNMDRMSVGFITGNTNMNKTLIQAFSIVEENTKLEFKWQELLKNLLKCKPSGIWHR